MKSIRYLLMLSLILFFSKESYGQIQCPDLTGYTLDVFTMFDGNNDYFNPIVRSQYSYKGYGGSNFDITVNWSTLYKEGHYNFTDKQAREMVIQSIIRDRLGNCPNEQTYTFNFYEEKTCYQELKCYLKVDQTNSIYCSDDQWTGTIPWYFDWQGTKYYPITQKISCGTACCTTQYIVECESYGLTGGSRWSIVSKSSSISTGCGTSTTLDCKTNEIIPCEVDCE